MSRLKPVIFGKSMMENITTEKTQDICGNQLHPGNFRAKSSVFFSWCNNDDIFPTPYRPLIFLILSLLVVESFIEIVLANYLLISVGYHILLDAGLMFVLLLPFLYYFLYLPYKRHHQYHEKAQAQIHYLSRQLINTSENERKLLSQNLHDGFGQALTAMQFRIETIRSSCLVNSPGCLEQTEQLSRQISGLGDFVREVSTGLHPHMLDELGLEVTLKWHLEEFGREYKDIKVTSSLSEGEFCFPAEIELAVFRVCQEALNNVAKHAKAKSVVLSLDLEEANLHLRIEDDGEGFDLKELKAMGSQRSGIGLLGMRERIDALGGRLSIKSAPGKGTSIHAEIPKILRGRKHESHTSSDR